MENQGQPQAPPQNETPDELKARIEAWMNETWNKVQYAYTVYHQNVWKCRIFYAGEFWISWDKTNRVYRPQEPQDDFVPQPNINRFSPAVDAIASNFSNIPEVEAVAKPDDDYVAMGVAEVANKLADYCIKDNALRADLKSDEDKGSLAAKEFSLSGTVFTIVYPERKVVGQQPQISMQPAWSYKCAACGNYEESPEPQPMCSQCGAPVEPQQVERAAPVMDEAGQPLTQPVTEVKIKVQVGDPISAFPRTGSKSMGRTPHFLWAERMSLEEIFERWGAEDVAADSDRPDGYNSHLETALNYHYLGYSTAAQAAQDAALVKQAYVLPGKMRQFPAGFYAVMVNSKVIYWKPWDEEFCEHPMTKGDYTALPTSFFARSIAFDLAEVAQRLVEYESIIELHAKCGAVEPMVIDEMSVVTKPTGRLDKIVYWKAYAPGVKEPHRMKYGQLDPEIYKKVETLKQEMENIAHLVQVFKGEQPGGVTAASAIQTLRGQAELQFAEPVKNWSNLWKETVRKVIKNYQKYFTTAQIARIVGADRIAQINDFKQADLDTCLDYVATSSGLPKTRDEKRQEMMTLFDKGALDINDPNIKEKVFELFGETGIMKTFNLDARRARLNVRTIKDGGTALFRAGIDDPMVHMGIALEAAKGLDFDQWDEPNQEVLYAYLKQIQGVIAALAPPPEPVPDGDTAKPKEKKEEKPAAGPPNPMVM